jgi:acyl-CoA reductase-like NAD-dependent aldehyde dehydrogenase
MAAAEVHGAVVRELQGERASALARVTERLEEALGELAAAEAARRGRPGDRTLAALEADALAHAGERLWYVVIHREALGLTRHDVLDDVYRIPRGVHAAMGPRRR